MVKDSSIKIRLTTAERLKFKEYAKSKGITLSDLVREVLNRELNNSFGSLEVTGAETTDHCKLEKCPYADDIDYSCVECEYFI